MINSASGYACVDVTGLSDFITGDIMPVRDIRGDGSCMALKYEDLLFLQEAYLERHDLSPPQQKATPPGRVLNNSIAAYFIGSGATFITQNYFVNKGIQIPSFQAGVSALGDVLTGPVGLVAYEGITSKTRLDADYLRKMYWNVSKLSRTRTLALPGTVLGTTLVATSTQTDSGGNNTTSTSTQSLSSVSLLSDSIYAYRYMGGTTCRYYEYSFSGNVTPVSASWVGTATAVFIMHTYYRTRSGTANYYDFVSAPCTVSNGSIFPSIDFAAIAQTVLAAHGISYFSGPTYEPDIYNVDVMFSNSSIVIDHDFPAEIDSLNWNWQPS